MKRLIYDIVHICLLVSVIFFLLTVSLTIKEPESEEEFENIALIGGILCIVWMFTGIIYSLLSIAAMVLLRDWWLIVLFFAPYLAMGAAYHFQQELLEKAYLFSAAYTVVSAFFLVRYFRRRKYLREKSDITPSQNEIPVKSD